MWRLLTNNSKIKGREEEGAVTIWALDIEKEATRVLLEEESPEMEADGGSGPAGKIHSDDHLTVEIPNTAHQISQGIFYPCFRFVLVFWVNGVNFYSNHRIDVFLYSEGIELLLIWEKFSGFGTLNFCSVFKNFISSSGMLSDEEILI